MNRLAFLAFGCIVASMLGGCGGGGGTLAPTGTQQATRVGRATFRILWPERTRLIPAASESIRVDLLEGDQPLASHVFVRADGGESVYTFENVPVGTFTGVAKAYPNANGTGVAQAAATVSVTVQDGANTNVTLTMGSTIDTVEIGPTGFTSLSVGLGQTLQLTGTPRDVEGNVVLVSGGGIAWTSSDSGTAPVDANGRVTGAATGTVDITATETESGKSAGVTVSVRDNRMRSGEYWRGSLGVPGAVSVFPFEATAGGAASLFVAGDPTGGSWNGSYVLVAELRAPDGSQVRRVLGGSSGTAAFLSGEPLTQSGTYSLMVYDNDGKETGSFGVSLQLHPGASSSPQDPDGGTTSSGASVSGSLLVGDLDAISFDAAAGDVVSLFAAGNPAGDSWNGSYVLTLELHAPDGALVAKDVGGSSGTAASLTAQSLTQAGTYTCLVYDNDGKDTGEYTLSLLKSPGSPNSAQDPDGGTLNGSDTASGSLTVGDLDAISFSGQSGSTVTLHLAGDPAGGQWNGDYVLQLTLVAPDGTVVATDTGGSSGTAASIDSATLPLTGTYVVLIHDSDGKDAGTYTVSLVTGGG